MKKLNEIGQIRSDWADIDSPDSPHRVLDSPGGFGQFFQKIRGKIKFEFSKGKTKNLLGIAKFVATELAGFRAVRLFVQLVERCRLVAPP